MMHSLYGNLGGGVDPILSAAAAAMMDPLLASKDTTFTKIFVGGLPYHTTDKTLKEYFEVFGDIEEAVVITDRQTSKSRGYGFVTMKDRASAERACKDPNPIIDGRKANVNLAYLGAKPRGNLQLAGEENFLSGLSALPQLAALNPGLIPRLSMQQLYYPAVSPLLAQQQAGLVLPQALGSPNANNQTQTPNAAAAQYLAEYNAAASAAYAAAYPNSGATAASYDPYTAAMSAAYQTNAANYGLLPYAAYAQNPAATQNAAAYQAAAVAAAQQAHEANNRVG